MSSPAAKRRRIDAASHTLSKPFRSPLKMPLEANTADNLPAQKLPYWFDTLPPNNGDGTRILDPTKLRLLPAVTPSPRNAERKTFSSPIFSAAIDADPDIDALIKTQRRLEKELRELKEELDTAEQARRIEVNSEKKNAGGAVDGELSLLILKWRAASRQAAEELFTGVRDRVNRYAGMRPRNVHAAGTEMAIEWFRADFVQDGGPKSMERDARETERVSKWVGSRTPTARLGR
jgi:Swi5-dependent recombination DNA repair protein 1